MLAGSLGTDVQVLAWIMTSSKDGNLGACSIPRRNVITWWLLIVSSPCGKMFLSTTNEHSDRQV